MRVFLSFSNSFKKNFPRLTWGLIFMYMFFLSFILES